MAMILLVAFGHDEIGLPSMFMILLSHLARDGAVLDVTIYGYDTSDRNLATRWRCCLNSMVLTTVSAAARKARTEWTARSLCSLSVRYQATNQECSVQSCLNLFTAPEFLTGSNKYACDNCARAKAAESGAKAETTVLSVASKQLLVFTPPAVLTLHLKRFTQNGVNLRKAQKHVDFPVLLDLAPFCSAAAAGVSNVRAGQKRVLYSLYGVIEHSGRLTQVSGPVSGLWRYLLTIGKCRLL